MRKIDLDRWQRYFQLREEGHSVEKAARGSKIDAKTAWRFERGEPGSTGLEAAEHFGITHVGGLEVAPDLSSEAKQGLEDFAYFRRRYFGRVSQPWQERAAYDVLDALGTSDREYVVINCPPGSGKSTLFTHDIPAWLIVRDRSIRMQVGSRTERQARMYVGRLKKTFEREAPMLADSASRDAGAAFDADATIAGDYGAFKPEGRTDLWRAEALVVRQFNGMALDDKEPTVSAWGQDSGFLGGRFDFVIWDDLVDRKNTKGEDASANLQEWWLTEAETRIEPGGLLVLQGQRMMPDDLYRFCLDLRDLDNNPKYKQIKYQAHDETRCTGQHEIDSPAWPTGCLLDPFRLPWKFLSNIAAVSPRTFDIQYQQNDGGSTSLLVEEAWIKGGTDSHGVKRKGCLDDSRILGKSSFPDFTGWSVLSVDPSPANFWGVTWWVARPDLNQYELLGVWRQRMGSEQFLSMDLNTMEFSGLAEKVRQMANDTGHPLQALIVEVNAAQKFLLAQPHLQKWATDYDITTMPHTTTINKADPQFGVTGIADFFRQAAIRLPYGDARSRLSLQPLIHELLTWPEGKTEDLVMSTWFFIRAVQMTYADPTTPPPKFDRPKWLGHGRSLASVYSR